MGVAVGLVLFVFLIVHLPVSTIGQLMEVEEKNKEDEDEEEENENGTSRRLGRHVFGHRLGAGADVHLLIHVLQIAVDGLHA
jgi:hypothetical protein